jgi:alkylation response protein AidB-like acyl-CoA dehydrogenase
MDFNDTPEQSQFRAEARAFLDAHAQLKTEAEARDETESEYLLRAKAWQKLKYEQGWACLNCPRRNTAGATTHRRRS